MLNNIVVDSTAAAQEFELYNCARNSTPRSMKPNALMAHEAARIERVQPPDIRLMQYERLAELYQIPAFDLHWSICSGIGSPVWVDRRSDELSAI